jgi:hypothetical protein
MRAGYEGLLRDKTRPSRIPPLGSNIAERVVALKLMVFKRKRRCQATAFSGSGLT